MRRRVAGCRHPAARRASGDCVGGSEVQRLLLAWSTSRCGRCRCGNPARPWVGRPRVAEPALGRARLPSSRAISLAVDLKLDPLGTRRQYETNDGLHSARGTSPGLAHWSGIVTAKSARESFYLAFLVELHVDYLAAVSSKAGSPHAMKRATAPGRGSLGAEHPHPDCVGGDAPVGSGGSMACRSRIVVSVGVEGKPTDVSRLLKSSLAHRRRACSSDSQTPMMYSASRDVAQWCRNSPAPTAPPRRMIVACALSYASVSSPTSPLNRAISTTGMKTSASMSRCRLSRTCAIVARAPRRHEGSPAQR